MYYDLGLSDRVFEIEQVSGSDIVSGLSQLIKGYDSELDRVRKLGKSIQRTYEKSIKSITYF